MNPTMKNQLIKWKQHQEPTPKKQNHRQESQERHIEQLSDWEWKEMMGQFGQRLNRRNGALRRGR
ncbi:hypothetical protein [Peribacillus asahii]|uniref:hypothetical protein n=1 Tax=Peribacillus asahii TaxID=228899 RepID=UPI00381E8896